MSVGFSTRKAKPPTTKGGGASLAAKVAIQVLFATGKTMTIEGLRGKLREWFLAEADGGKRAIASLSTMELVAALVEANTLLSEVGLQIQLINGTACLVTTRVEPALASDYLREATEQSGNPMLSTAALEVLSCIAFKQPVSQAEIDRLFDSDKRSLVLKLRELKLVEEFAGEDGRLRFATTPDFLRRFGLGSLEDLTIATASLLKHENSRP
jgi:segregation and condensation protein B